MFLLLSALAPSALLLWFFYARDRNREPGRVVWATFGLGVLSILPVLLVALPVAKVIEGLAIRGPYAHGFLEALATAALPEEGFKLCVVALYASRHRAFDEPMDGVVYGAVASLGFATLENLMYVADSGGGTAILRALSSVPGHAAMGGLMGYYVGQARFGDPARRGSRWLAAYLVPVTLHALYDFPLLTLKHAPHHHGKLDPTGGMALLVLVSMGVLVVELVWVLRVVSRLRREQLATALANAQRIQAVAATVASAGGDGVVNPWAGGGAA